MTEVDDFLEHFGVKGMRWGQRKSDGSRGAGSNGQPKPPKKKLTAAERRERQKKVNKAVNRTMITVGVGLYLSSFLSPSSPARSTPVRTLSSRPQAARPGSTPHVIPPNARQTMMLQERQRNGAYQVRQTLRSMGADVV